MTREESGSKQSAAVPVPVYEALSRQIKAMGAECAFGLMSDDTAEFAVTLDSMGVRFIGTRHENNAITMAEGYASALRKVSFALIGRGPAAANGLHAAMYALRTGTGVVIMYGEAAVGARPANSVGPDYKAFNALGVMQAAGLQVFRPVSAAAALQSLYDAVQAASTGCAVALLLPVDIQHAQIAFVPTPPPVSIEPAAVDAVPATDASVQLAADILARSQKPLLLAGRGAYFAGAKAVLEALSERTGALLTTTARAKEMFAGHPYNAGIVGSFSTAVARRFVEQADCVVAFGASLNQYTSSHGMALPKVPLIQVDRLRENIGRWLNVDAAIIGDTKVVAQQLLDALGERDVQQTGFRTTEVADALSAFDIGTSFEPKNTSRTLDPRVLGVKLNRLLPKHRNMVYDGGHFIGVVPYIDVPGPEHFKLTIDFASVGMGIGTALGVAKARPDVPTVLVIGDGGLMMTLSELETAVREDLPLVVIVMNDCAYGAELHVLKPRQLPVEKSLFPDIDFADVAASLAFEAATIRTVDDLEAASGLIASPTGPVLLDCKINPDVVAPFMAEAGAAAAANAKDE